MKNKLDIKSALLGLFVGLVAVLAIAAKPVSPQGIGRFQLGHVGPNNMYMLVDTATGEVWYVSDQDFKKPKL